MPSENAFPKLDGNNYYEWRMLMEAVLIRKGLMEYVDGTRAVPLGSPNSKVVKDFLKKQAEARAEIVLQVETPQLSHVRDRDPRIIWTTLQTVHRGFATRLTLRRKFIMLKKTDDMTMQAWIAHVRRVAFQLQEMIDVSVSDEDIILVLTIGLPPSYNNFIVTLDSTPYDDLTLDYVISRLMNEEARQSHATDSNASALHDAALVSHVQRHRVPLKNITCFHCGEKGHY
jgi:hypothetical protein